jgi:hypothetical protein
MSETLTREQQIDTRLAELYGAANKVDSDLASLRVSLHGLLGIRDERRDARGRGFVFEYPHSLAEVAEMARTAEVNSWDERRRTDLLDRLANAEAEQARIAAEAKPLNDTYAAERWSRFFLVNNSNGHIHSSMHCSTCNRLGSGTSFSWLPTVSGLTEADAVAAHGPTLCTVCFPTAPIEWTVGEAKPVDPNRCPGSGTHDHDSSGLRYYSPRAVCNHCKQTTSVTSTGKLRQHKVEVGA